MIPKRVSMLLMIFGIISSQFGQELNKGEMVTSFSVVKDNGAQCYCDTNYGKLIETGKITFNGTTKNYEQNRYEVIYETNIINILQYLELTNWKVFKDNNNQKGMQYSEYFAKSPVNYTLNTSLNQSITFETNGLEPHIIVTCTMTSEEYNAWYKNAYNTLLFIGEEQYDRLNTNENNKHKPFYVKNASGATTNVKFLRVFNVAYFQDPEFINKITFGKQVAVGFETHAGFKKIPLSPAHIQALKDMDKIYQLFVSRILIKGAGNIQSYRPVIVSKELLDSVLYYTNNITLLDKKCKAQFMEKIDAVKAKIKYKYDSLENIYAKSGVREKSLLLSDKLEKLQESYRTEYRNLTPFDKREWCKKYGIAESKLTPIVYERQRKTTDNNYIQTQKEYKDVEESRKKFPNTTPYLNVLSQIDELVALQRLNIKELKNWDKVKITELYDKLKILKR